MKKLVSLIWTYIVGSGRKDKYDTLNLRTARAFGLEEHEVTVEHMLDYLWWRSNYEEKQR